MTVLVVDLSNNNTVVDISRLRLSGVTGMWHKVTEGTRFVDKYWPERAAEARRAGLRVGGYHFAHPGKAVKPQALSFIAALGKVGRRDLRPVLDCEVIDGAPLPELEAWARDFVHLVKQSTGVGCLFYSYPSFITGMKLARPVGYGLWLASYGRNDGKEHPYVVPKPWRKAVAHQFTSDGRIPGIAGRADLTHAVRLAPLLAHPVLGL
jgi:lysozyme